MIHQFIVTEGKGQKGRLMSLLRGKLQRIKSLRNKTFQFLDTDQTTNFNTILQTLDEYENSLNINLGILKVAKSRSELDKVLKTITDNETDLDVIEKELDDIQKSVVKPDGGLRMSASNSDDDVGGGGGSGSSKIPSSLIDTLLDRQKQNIKTLDIELDNLDSVSSPKKIQNHHQIKKLIKEIHRLKDICLSNRQIINNARIPSDLTNIVDIDAIIIQLTFTSLSVIRDNQKKQQTYLSIPLQSRVIRDALLSRQQQNPFTPTNVIEQTMFNYDWQYEKDFSGAKNSDQLAFTGASEEDLFNSPARQNRIQQFFNGNLRNKIGEWLVIEWKDGIFLCQIYAIDAVNSRIHVEYTDGSTRVYEISDNKLYILNTSGKITRTGKTTTLLDVFGYIASPVNLTPRKTEQEYLRRGWTNNTNNKWTMNHRLKRRHDFRLHNINKMAAAATTSLQNQKLGSVMLQRKSGEYELYLISKSMGSKYNLTGVGVSTTISSNIDWSTRKLDVNKSTIVDAWPIKTSTSSSGGGGGGGGGGGSGGGGGGGGSSKTTRTPIPSRRASGGGGSGGGSSKTTRTSKGFMVSRPPGWASGGSQSPQGATKMPNSPSVQSGGSSGSSSPSAPPLSNVWEYRDNDDIYYPYDDNACATINDQVQNKNYGQFAQKFTVSSDGHTFDVILTDENEGKQSGALNTRHIRRQGVLKQQSTTSVSPSASMSPSASNPGSYSGNAVQDFKTKAWTDYANNPTNLTRVKWFEDKCAERGFTGNWEWDPPYEMTQNRPPDFSDSDKIKLGEDPIKLWEYRGKNAMNHRSNGKGRDLEFIGFFRFTGNRCGRGPNDLVDHTLPNVQRLRNTYGEIKMNILYHATNKIKLANLILPSKFIGAFSTTVVYGKGTYFAMGPHVDYTFGNNIYGNVYASWRGNNVDGYAYVVVSHAATRPSLVSDSSSMVNGFTGYNSKTYITGGSLGSTKSKNLPLANREIVYGDRYDRNIINSGCPVDDLIFVVGVAVFKL